MFKHEVNKNKKADVTAEISAKERAQLHKKGLSDKQIDDALRASERQFLDIMIKRSQVVKRGVNAHYKK